MRCASTSVSVSERELVVAVANQLIFQRLVILDDAIVNEGDCRWRRNADVRFRRSTLPCVAQRVWLIPKVPEGGFSAMNSVRGRRCVRRICVFRPYAVDDRDAGRVVAAIFQAPQTIQKDGCSFRSPDISDDSAHDSVERGIKGACATRRGGMERRLCQGPNRPEKALAQRLRLRAKRLPTAAPCWVN